MTLLQLLLRSFVPFIATFYGSAYFLTFMPTGREWWVAPTVGLTLLCILFLNVGIFIFCAFAWSKDFRNKP